MGGQPENSSTVRVPNNWLMVPAPPLPCYSLSQRTSVLPTDNIRLSHSLQCVCIGVTANVDVAGRKLIPLAANINLNLSKSQTWQPV